jgi:hypothetical protein
MKAPFYALAVLVLIVAVMVATALSLFFLGCSAAFDRLADFWIGGQRALIDTIGTLRREGLR